MKNLEINKGKKVSASVIVIGLILLTFVNLFKKFQILEICSAYDNPLNFPNWILKPPIFLIYSFVCF